ncbi:decarboxylase [Streptomyces sp. RB6PN25]|uniref:Decarboxylase n=1 Tax=Streptomyces humicola TaxID=2953240 RepID=A0ABT1PZ02_9ACTN|nr:decarboxylase [Streptomyces humicola]MCQ4082887.1 decarboxylase [Streptomyces humicola]
MDITFLGGPLPQRGVGVVAPFDFALDRELWRWVPDEVSLHLTRTPFVPVEVSLDMARMISEHETLREAVRALHIVMPESLAYACTSGSFVGGRAGEEAMCAAMRESAAGLPAVTTSGALLEALRDVGARRIAVVTPYTKSVTDSLEAFLGEAGIAVTGRAYLGLTREIWRVPYRDVVDMARNAVVGAAEALFISCTNLPTYDVIPQLEAELRMPVLSANQVTMWAALRRMGAQAVGPYQALLDPEARVGIAPAVSAVVLPPMEIVEPGQGFPEQALAEPALAEQAFTEPSAGVPEPALAGQPLGEPLAEAVAEAVGESEAFDALDPPSPPSPPDDLGGRLGFT